MAEFLSWNGSQRENNWSKNNFGRCKKTKYDELWLRAESEMDEAKHTRYFIEMNDTLIRDVASIALVNRRNVIGYPGL